MSTSKLFNKEQQAAIVNAIKAAEKETSGEIRVHIEKSYRGNAMERAVECFNKLQMYKTRARNGVLIYLAIRDHQFAVVGDEGINNIVPENFWDNLVAKMKKEFAAGKFVEGIVVAVTEAGQLLKQYFPYCDGDENERPDEISFK